MLKMQGQLKSHPRQGRRSSRNSAPSPGTSDNKPKAMLGQSLSPAKKLAKLMRERPLNGSPKMPSVGGSKSSGTNNSNTEKPNNPRKAQNADQKSLSTGKKSRTVKESVKPSNSKRDVDVSGERASGAATKSRKSITEAPGKNNVTTSKPRKDSNPPSSSARKRSKHEHVEDKRPKKPKKANGHHSSDRERPTEHGSSSSSPTKKHRTKKPRAKAERDARAVGAGRGGGR